MGSDASEKDGKDNEQPRHAVEIAYPFAVGVHEVTLAEWEACVNDGGCSSVPSKGTVNPMAASGLLPT